VDFNLAPDIQHRITRLVKKLDLHHIDPSRLVCFRSHGSKSRARARIWSLPRIWQMALGAKAHYCIEVLAEKFDQLSQDDQTKVLIHELMHIPKTFSGALLAHRRKGRAANHHTVEKFFKKLKNNDL
jgi:predicted metallopeptidase